MLILTTQLIYFWWSFIFVSSKACWISANCCYSPDDVNVNRPLPSEALAVAVWPASQLPALSLIWICDPDKLIACNRKNNVFDAMLSIWKKTPVKQRISYTDMSHQTRESVVSYAGYITRIKNTGIKCISFCNGLNTVTNSLFYKHNQNIQQRIYLYIESGVWSNTLNFVYTGISTLHCGLSYLRKSVPLSNWNSRMSKYSRKDKRWEQTRRYMK